MFPSKIENEINLRVVLSFFLVSNEAEFTTEIDACSLYCNTSYTDLQDHTRRTKIKNVETLCVSRDRCMSQLNKKISDFWEHNTEQIDAEISQLQPDFTKNPNRAFCGATYILIALDFTNCHYV